MKMSGPVPKNFDADNADNLEDVRLLGSTFWVKYLAANSGSTYNRLRSSSR